MTIVLALILYGGTFAGYVAQDTLDFDTPTMEQMAQESRELIYGAQK